jgi:ribose transport system substrate-binding protein
VTWRAGLTFLAGSVVIAALLSGCGSGSGSGKSATNGGAESAFLKEAEKTIRRVLGPGGYGKPPTTAPSHKPGMKIALISCGQQFPGCWPGIDEAKVAAEELGWTATIFDTKGDPNTAGEGIRQAVAAGDQGIFTYFIDCQYAKAALEEAKAAGVPVINSEGRDCPKPLFAGSLTYNSLSGPSDFEQWYSDYNRIQVDYAAVAQEGDANIIFFGDTTSLNSREAQQAAEDEVKKCGTCQMTAITFPTSAIGTELQSLAESAILQHPEANTIIVAYGDILVGGVMAAVEQSGRKLLLSSGEGLTAAMELVREKKANYGVCLPGEWEGWAAIDGLVRLMAGAPLAPTGIGLQIYDQTHNLVPPGQPCHPPVDFRADYRKAWGVGS